MIDQEMMMSTYEKECEMCRRPIVERFYLIVGDSMSIHDYCLRCGTCSRLIDERETKKCFYRDGKFHCPECFHLSVTSSSSSSSCIDSVENNNNSSHDEGSYHLTDLSSSSSSSSCSSSSSLSSRERMKRPAWSSCHKCSRPIEHNQYFIRLDHRTGAVMYHTECFRCAKCLCRIESGCPYGLRSHPTVGEEILCQSHYSLSYDEMMTPLNPVVDLNKNLNNNNNSNERKFSNDDTTTKTTTATTKKSIVDRSLFQVIENGVGSVSTKPATTIAPLVAKVSSTIATTTSTTTTSSSSSRKKKRVRTSFKHQQLRVMKAYFQVNQNPDSKELKELSERTGLQKRVLQVWFQNSRAKQRKFSMISSSSSSSSSIVDINFPHHHHHHHPDFRTSFNNQHHHHHLHQHQQQRQMHLQPNQQQQQQQQPSSIGDEEDIIGRDDDACSGDENDDEDEDEDDDDNDGDDDDDNKDGEPSDSTATSEFVFDFY